MFITERPIRGELLCLQMQDHYLAVHSTDGEQLILCRMEDAARELDGLGRRVHRSWWVAHDAVEAVNRHNVRMSLLLKDGREVRVSRTYQQEVAKEKHPSRMGRNADYVRSDFNGISQHHHGSPGPALNLGVQSRCRASSVARFTAVERSCSTSRGSFLNGIAGAVNWSTVPVRYRSESGA